MNTKKPSNPTDDRPGITFISILGINSINNNIQLTSLIPFPLFMFTFDPPFKV